jgi:hypothetical protein
LIAPLIQIKARPLALLHSHGVRWLLAFSKQAARHTQEKIMSNIVENVPVELHVDHADFGDMWPVVLSLMGSMLGLGVFFFVLWKLLG